MVEDNKLETQKESSLDCYYGGDPEEVFEKVKTNFSHCLSMSANGLLRQMVEALQSGRSICPIMDEIKTSGRPIVFYEFQQCFGKSVLQSTLIDIIDYRRTNNLQTIIFTDRDLKEPYVRNVLKEELLQLILSGRYMEFQKKE